MSGLPGPARAELTAAVQAAHARGAQALIVTPHFGAEDATERAMRHRLLDGLPCVFVNLGPGQRLPRDPHPSAEGDHVIAEAITARLKAGG